MILQDMEAKCLDCNNLIPTELEVDIQLCPNCMKNYNVDKLWDMHDKEELNALDFNENKEMREKFRRRKECQDD